VLVTWFYHAPLENHADSQVTPLGTTAPWYFLWLQGGLKLGDKVIWGIVFPTIIFGFLIVMPYLDMGISRRFAHRRFMLTVGLVMMVVVVIMSYMGLPEFGVKVTADHEILHELVMPPQHNHLGKLLPIPYDQIVVGMYTTREIEAGAENAATAVNAFNQEIASNGQRDAVLAKLQTVNAGVTNLNFTTVPSDAPEMEAVLKWFDGQLAAYPGELQGGVWGGLIVTQDQTNTKRIDAVIVWPQDNGASQQQTAAIVPIAQVATAEATASADATQAATPSPSSVWRVESDLVFINENSQYFEAPGA